MQTATLAGFAVALATLAAVPEAAAAPRIIRCCVTVPNDDGTERPWCFNLRVRPARRARRVCRLVGGHPMPPERAR